MEKEPITFGGNKMKLTELKLRKMIRNIIKEGTAKPLEGLSAGMEGDELYFVFNNKKFNTEEFIAQLKGYLGN